MKTVVNVLEGFFNFVGGVAVVAVALGWLYWYTDHLVISCKPRACLIYIQ